MLQETSETDGAELSMEEGKGEESIIGAIALITGTTVGAGILALPATAAPAVSTEITQIGPHSRQPPC